MGWLKKPKESEKQLGVNSSDFKARLSFARSKGKRRPSRGQALEEMAYRDFGITNKQEHIKPIIEAPVRPKKGTDASEGSAVVNSGTGSSGVSVSGESQYVQSDTSIGDVGGGGKIRRKQGLSSVLGVM